MTISLPNLDPGQARLDEHHYLGCQNWLQDLQVWSEESCHVINSTEVATLCQCDSPGRVRLVKLPGPMPERTDSVSRDRIDQGPVFVVLVAVVSCVVMATLLALAVLLILFCRRIKVSETRSTSREI